VNGIPDAMDGPFDGGSTMPEPGPVPQGGITREGEGPGPAPALLLDARHDDPDLTGELIDFDPCATGSQPVGVTAPATTDDQRLKECPRCRDRIGHNAIGAAHCAYRAATTAAIRELAGEHALAAADLLAHLRSVHSDPDAYDTARLVIDLGWRPAIFGEVS
jgi:hypothetical protein